jgi:MFS family permease
MAGDLGLVLGPIVTGWVADAAGYSPAFVVCAAVCVAPVFVVLAAPETLQRDRRVSAAAIEESARDAAGDAT